jgi:hypothetical protein
LALALLALLPASLWATERFFLIGGGPSPESSEAQIEFNVKWVVASLREMLPTSPITVFFAGGQNAPNTVVELLPRTEGATFPMEAIASVYGEELGNRHRFRPHTVENVAASTERDSLIPALTEYLTNLRPGEQAMIIYNGHGSWESNRSENALRLWNQSYLSVRDFEGILAKVDPKVPVRFVMTQCYSGAFARAVHPSAEPSLELARGQRCGFFAESSERESEGCSASIELGDYRDYTTYFIAGLTGRDRFGREIPKATDRDADGRVTPFDSHLHTLLEGYNGDLPRSTSEDYLERAQPWYLRWVGTSAVPDNVYGRLAREMAEQYGLPADGRALGRILRQRYDSLQGEVARVEAEVSSVEAAADRTQKAIQGRVERKFPALGQPYTEPFRLLLTEEPGPVEAEIRSDSSFRTLVEQQDRLAALELKLIDLDRLLSQLDRLRRARLMARALAQTERGGARTVQASYSQLRACEALPLGAP